MYPVLITIGPVTISTFGFFMALALLSAAFVIWRLSRVYDIEAEKTIDLIILTFAGGVIGARLLFVGLHLGLFDTLEKIALLNIYPGLSFWGGILGGLLFLWFFVKRTKLHLWQMLDFAAIGLVMGLILGNIGCFLGGCSYGIESNLAIATPVVGILGKRLPIALFESLAFLIIFYYLWKQVIRFHFAGKIVALSFILIGLVKFTTEFYRGDVSPIPFLGFLTLGNILSFLLFLSGIYIFYDQSKRNIILDLKKIFSIFHSSRSRKQFLSNLSRTWYNTYVQIKLNLQKLFGYFSIDTKSLKRRLNVKANPKHFR